jgi:hypothetical protein
MVTGWTGRPGRGRIGPSAARIRYLDRASMVLCTPCTDYCTRRSPDPCRMPRPRPARPEFPGSHLHAQKRLDIVAGIAAQFARECPPARVRTCANCGCSQRSLTMPPPHAWGPRGERRSITEGLHAPPARVGPTEREFTSGDFKESPPRTRAGGFVAPKFVYFGRFQVHRRSPRDTPCPIDRPTRPDRERSRHRQRRTGRPCGCADDGLAGVPRVPK